MPYTIHDWFAEHAEVRVRIPDAGTWLEVWVPFLAVSENNYPVAWGERWPGTFTGEQLYRLGLRPVK